MSVEGKVAKKYARALLRALPVDQLDQVDEALTQFATLYRESAPLRAALLDPGASASQQLDAVSEIANRVLPNSNAFSNFLCLLQDNGRMSGISEIADTFKELVAALKKQLTLEVTSAFELSEAEREELLSSVRGSYGDLVSITWEIDPSILGGLRVKAGDKLLDASVRGSLNKMSQQLQF